VARRGAFLLAALIALMIAPTMAMAEGTLHPSIVPDGSHYYRQAVQGTDATTVTFPGNAMSAEIENEASVALLVRFTRSTEGVDAINEDIHVSDGELTDPPDSKWSQVQSIPAETAITFDVRRSRGLIADRASGSGAFTIRLID